MALAESKSMPGSIGTSIAILAIRKEGRFTKAAINGVLSQDVERVSREKARCVTFI